MKELLNQIIEASYEHGYQQACLDDGCSRPDIVDAKQAKVDALKTQLLIMIELCG